MDVLESFTVETFSDRIGEAFRIRFDPEDAVEAELVEVQPLGPAEGRRAPFSLVFRAPKDPIYPQRIYAVEHDELGGFEIFLVPIAPDEAGARYEAVFT
jgi:hypothetical protein